jgi:hypothetical protein
VRLERDCEQLPKFAILFRVQDHSDYGLGMLILGEFRRSHVGIIKGFAGMP